MQLNLKKKKNNIIFKHYINDDKVVEQSTPHTIMTSCAGVSISTDGQRNVSATLLIDVGYFFLEERRNELEQLCQQKV